MCNQFLLSVPIANYEQNIVWFDDINNADCEQKQYCKHDIIPGGVLTYS